MIKYKAVIAAVSIVSPLVKANGEALSTNAKESIAINIENAASYGVDYGALQKLFSKLRQVSPQETFLMSIYEDQNYISFHSFDGLSVNTDFNLAIVSPNGLGTGGTK